MARGAALVLAMGVLAVTPGCSSARSESAPGRSTTTTATTAKPVSTTTTAPPRPRYETVQSRFTVDRPSDPRQPTMGVFVVSPVGRGPFPLIVFSHGFRSIAQSYTERFEALARQGYVVVGPNFPYDDPRMQPADITLVIDRLSSAESPLPEGLVDLRHIAVAGHSLGGVGVYGVTYNSCCRDPRITAALTFEGALGTFAAGQFLWRGPPLLIVLGDRDPLIDPGTGTKILSNFETAAYLLTVKGGGHGGGMNPDDVGYTSVQTTVRDFLAAYLYEDASALRSLRSNRSLPSVTLVRR